MSVRQRLAEIRERIAAAARACGRSPEDIRLIGVCKRQPWERIWEAYDAGLRDFGESTAQGLKQTAAAFEEAGASLRWHFVGALQTNKVAQVVEHGCIVHSVDRIKLAKALSERSQRLLDVCVQVNVGREEQKAGVFPEHAVDFAQQVAGFKNLRVVGLMALPPNDDDPAQHFQNLAGLVQDFRCTPAGESATQLSMGMSGDFEAAIAAGATMIRIGTALFGTRPKRV